MGLDYKNLGFKAGIEIHQELDTNKLFCNCSSSMNEENLISTVQRKLRAVAGETGEVDLASAYEQIRDREFVYHGYENESCLVDLDEEPPRPLDKEAFKIALGVAKLFKLEVPDSICIMRKTVTDGSSVAGFQRTILVGIENKNSFIETNLGKVKIIQLNLEEDACKIEGKKGNKVFYSLSRQGIPLLEIGTDASIKNPKHVKEVAEKIGTLLRSFKVKRGLGTIRQDVNVSIKGGARIEVKGWQDLNKLPELVENEVLRQISLLKIKKELKKRKLKKFSKKTKDVTNIFTKTKSKIISKIIKNGGKVYGLLLPNFSGLLKKEICPGKTFGKELADYAVAYGTKGMIHTDEDLKKYKLENEFDCLKREFKAEKNDLILIVAEGKETVERAINSVYDRSIYALKGVPEETRVPNHHDATSSYARPLPGAHRLYPETDIPNIDVTKTLLNSIKIPELITDKINRLSKRHDISKSLAKELIDSNLNFEEYIKKYKKISSDFIARTIIESPKEIRKRYGREINIEEYIEDIFEKLNKKKISKDAVFEILIELSHGKKVDYSEYELMSDKVLEKEIKKIIDKNKNLPLNAIVGKVMGKLRGKAEGKKIVDIVKKQFGK